MDSDHNVSSATLERQLDKPRSLLDIKVLTVTANLNSDLSDRVGGSNDENAVADAIDSGTTGAGDVAFGATIAAGILRGGAIPENSSFGGDGDIACSCLVGGNVVREDESPTIVRHFVDVDICPWNDTLRPDRANVVCFAIVIPGDDLPYQV